MKADQTIQWLALRRNIHHHHLSLVLLLEGLVVVGSITFAGSNDYLLNAVILTLFWAAAATAWNVLGGYVGMLSLGHSLFLGASAYLVVILVTRFHATWWLAMLLAMVAVTGFGTLLLFPAFRLRGPFFSLATFALPTVATIIAIYEAAYTGGSQGITWPYQPDPASLTFASRAPYLIVVAAILALTLFVSYLIHRSKWGRYMRATRDDDQAAEATGVPTTQVKLVATAISIALTALCGGFYVAYIAFLDPPSAFSLDFSVDVVLFAILGGMGTLYGPLVGAAILVPIDFLLSANFSGTVHLLLYGVLLMLVVLFMPKGIVGDLGPRLQRLTRRGR